MSFRFHFVARLGFFFLLFGCSTSPVLPLLNHEEIVNRDRALGDEIAQNFKLQFKFKSDFEVLRYLKNLGQELVNSTQQLAEFPVGVWIFLRNQEKWFSYGLPGNRIYLPLDLLKSLDFENEIAAAMAIQFGHLLRRDLAEQISREEFIPNANIDVNNIFSFPEVANLKATILAVGILYRSGYDARGLISLFKRFEKDPDHSPYEKGILEKMIQQARREISMNTPMRNPIVRSQNFLLIQKRMHSL